MPVPMKRPITEDSVDLSFRVPVAKADIAREAIEKILELAGIEFSISEETGEMVSWEEAFPEYGPADALRGARHMEGLTQAQLAERIDIKPHHISEMENGKRTIGKKMAKRLANALNTEYKVFM